MTQERNAVAAEQQQRHDPPRCREDDGEHPRTDEPPHARSGRRESSHRAAGTSAANTRAALIAPMNSTATPDRIAARRGDPRRTASTSGTTTHGAMHIGNASAETGPSTVSTWGDSANARPAINREPGVPIRSRAARTTTPVKATHNNADHHSRCTAHIGRCAILPRAKNGPIGNRYPYAWFWTCPAKPCGSHMCSARPRNPSGIRTRSTWCPARERRSWN